MVKVDDPAMIAGLLEFYNDENIQTATKEDFENSENWMFASLIMILLFQIKRLLSTKFQ